jgi:hypothetical protein
MQKAIFTRFLAAALYWYLLACSLACSTPAPEDAAKNAGLASSSTDAGISTPLLLLPQTTLPAVFLKDEITKQHDRPLVIASSMLTVAMVMRPSAEIRQGPGGQYELIDLVLPHLSKVLVMEQVGVWRKIVVRDTWQRGWVHSLALSKPVPSTKPLTMSSSLLPTVITVREVREVYDFPSRKKIAASIPKGTNFRSLRRDDFGSLVLVFENGTVMWLSRQDVR